MTTNYEQKSSVSQNVPGDFDVEDGCCTACAVPQAEAPNLFKFDDRGQSAGRTTMAHCYVYKRPSSETEVEQIANAMVVQELDCI